MTLSITIPALRQRMADAIPTHPKDDDSSDLASSYEVVALLVHAYFTALDFKLQGFNEDKRLDECDTLHPRLPSQWNNGFGSLSFVYRHKQSSLTFIVRVDRMGAKVEVRGLAVADENIYRVERSIRDIVEANALPIRITMKDGEEDREDLAEKISKVLKSDEAVTGLLKDVQTNIIQKLIPKLQREGYAEFARDEDASTTDANRRRQEARMRAEALQQDSESRARQGIFPGPAQPNIPSGHRPRPIPDFPPPGFEDEHEINRQPVPMMPGRSPFNIGHDDLNPPGLGPHDPLRGSFIGGGLPRPGGGGGMHPTFDDPLFTGQGGYGGQPGYDPQIPPGARWDPTGPGGDPRFARPGNGRGNNPFGGGGSGFGGGFGGSFGGDII